MKFNPSTTAEATAEQHEGREAYMKGVKECPYASGSAQGNQRYRWWVGWYDAQTEGHLGRPRAEVNHD